MDGQFARHLLSRTYAFEKDFPDIYKYHHRKIDRIRFELLLICIYPNIPRRDIFHPTLQQQLEQFDKELKGQRDFP